MPTVTWPGVSAASPISPERLSQIQARFSHDWVRLCEQARNGSLEPPKDRRFSGKDWASHPSFLFMAHAYLLSANAMEEMVDAAALDDAVRERLRFSVMQWVEAVAPTNFMATNPEVQRKLIETQGMSLRDGLMNLLGDLQKGRLTQTDESQFQVGENLAITPGSVVYQNTLFQLIQYAPSTDKVYRKPLLLVPPCINKFYILDLQPQSSLVRYAVDQGFTVFLISWRNPVPADTDGIEKAAWDDYLEKGVLQAIQVASAITRQKTIHTLGFCVGGTLLASALALATARGRNPAHSLTLLTTLLDFREAGVLNVFVDELHARTREQQIGQGGLMTARELATTFSFLRPSELVWNYVVDNYMKGGTPPAFDLLYWNSDSTNLPGPFFTWYFRNTYLENNLVGPDHVKVAGYPLDLTAIDTPCYIYGSREDHIVPWPAAYASTRVLSGEKTFVLGASGHIAGVINPPSRNKRHYWVLDHPQAALPANPTDWLESSTQHPGSWWPHWAGWLRELSGTQVKAPAQQGSTAYPAIEPAPGSYVKTRAV
ncbi:MAG: class I poly(R)-hydroxyalkanoic acid synthase [Burkholderiaceae bacterium]